MKKMPTEMLFLTVVALAASYLLVENMIRHYKQSHTIEEHPNMEKINLSEEEWKKRLSPQEFRILREKGTEPAFCGAFWDKKDKGIYKCRACGLPLFISDTKYDSKTGWPSFFQPIDDKRIVLQEDVSHGMKRTEVLCARCGSHLGHVFDDGPPPTGKRYCINSFALEFVKDNEQKK